VLEGEQRIGRIRFADERMPGVWLWNVTLYLPGGLPMGSCKDLDTAKAEFKPQAPDDEPRRGSVLRYLAASARKYSRPRIGLHRSARARRTLPRPYRRPKISFHVGEIGAQNGTERAALL
jgi:hypothetical protein